MKQESCEMVIELDLYNVYSLTSRIDKEVSNRDGYGFLRIEMYMPASNVCEIITNKSLGGRHQLLLFGRLHTSC